MVLDIGEIFWLEVEYEDISEESKRRPAIIIGKVEGSFLILVSLQHNLQVNHLLISINLRFRSITGENAASQNLHGC